MNRIPSSGFSILGALILSVLLTGCPSRGILLPVGNPTATPTPASTPPTPAGTPTKTSTPEISACGSTPLNSFLDQYASSSSLSNYSFFPFGSTTSTTAAALNYAVNSGELQEPSSAGATLHSYVMVNSAQFSNSLGNYTVEGDFKLDSRTDNYGLFGIEFLENSSVEGYIFQWNGNIEHGSTPHWQVEKDTGAAGSGYTYLAGAGFGTGVATPVYTPGNWVHLKVVVSGGGTTYNCYVNLYDGNGDQPVFSNETDTTGGTVYTSGGVGFRSEFLVDPNMLHLRNYHAFTCP